MLDVTGLNIGAIIVVWLLYVIVGAYWYSPAGFAKQWMKYTGVDMMKIPQADATKAIISVAVSALLQSITLAVVLNSLNAAQLVDGLLIGLVLWFGFTTATTVGTTLYSQRSWKFIVLNSSYFLLVMAVASIIFTLWQ